MGYLAKLIFGGQSLNLNDATYSLAADFAPPAPARAVNMAAGTFRNKSGGKRQGSQPKDRAWNFGVNILGASAAETHSALSRLQSFLDRCADASDTLYLEYNPSDAVSFAPLWGQSAYRYEIKQADLSVWSNYGAASLRNQAIIATCNLLIGPYAAGQKQRLGSGMGGLLEDVFGWPDGMSRGLRVPQATTNKIPTPLPGERTASYTAGSNITATKVTDGAYVYAGPSCMRLTSKGATNHTYTCSVNVGNTATYNLCAYFRMQDGFTGTASGDDTFLWYNGAVGPATYQSLGNGFWRMYVGVTGVNGAVNCGIAVQSGRTVYLSALQIEAVGRPTVLSYGDLLGNSWASTAHNSATTRVAGKLKIPCVDCRRPGQGTIRVVWRADYPSTGVTAGATQYLFSEDTSLLCAGWNQTGGSWFFNDGTNEITYQAAFAASTTYIFHFVYSQSGLKIYLNGSQVATGANYAPVATGTSLFVGTDVNGANPMEGIFYDLTTFSYSMGATEVANDAANITQAASEKWNVGRIPWLWTKDGDDVVDNHDDSGHDNWAVAGGIPGTDDARTLWTIDPMAAAVFSKTVWIGKHLDFYRDFQLPGFRFYNDLQGSADANCSGGEYEALNFPPGTERDGSTLTVTNPSNISGPFHFFLRAAASSGTISATVGHYLTLNGRYLAGDDKTCPLTTTYKLFYLGTAFCGEDTLKDISTKVLSWSINIATGGTAANVDFATVINGDLLSVDPFTIDVPGGGGSLAFPTLFYLDGTHAVQDNAQVGFDVRGQPINLTPDRYNLISVLHADDNGAHVITDTIAFTSCYVIPKWALV